MHWLLLIVLPSKLALSLMTIKDVSLELVRLLILDFWRWVIVLTGEL